MSDFTGEDHSHGLVLAGELDIATAPALDAALLGMSGDVLVDCADLRFIDSAGFYCLDRGYDVRDGTTLHVRGLWIQRFSEAGGEDALRAVRAQQSRSCLITAGRGAGVNGHRNKNAAQGTEAISRRTTGRPWSMSNR